MCNENARLTVMKKKLNGWQRIGILASVIWMLGAYLYTFSHEENEDIKINVIVEQACVDARPAGTPMKPCDDAMYAQINRDIPGERQWAAIVALVPIPLAWGFCYLAVFLVRWIKRGFARS
jgi:hypothetical protein